MEINSFERDRVKVLKNLDPAEIVNSLILIKKAINKMFIDFKKLEYKVKMIDEISLDNKSHFLDENFNRNQIKAIDISCEEKAKNSLISEEYERKIMRHGLGSLFNKSPTMYKTSFGRDTVNANHKNAYFKESKSKTKPTSKESQIDYQETNRNADNYKNHINSISHILSQEIDKIIQESQQEQAPREAKRNNREDKCDKMRVSNEVLDNSDSNEFSI
jgi:hypothetical protein